MDGKDGGFVHPLGGQVQAIGAGRPLPRFNLRAQRAQEIIDLLFRFNDGGTCVFFSTHDHEIVKTFGRRVIVINEGRIVSDIERKAPVDRSASLADRMYRPEGSAHGRGGREVVRNA